MAQAFAREAPPLVSVNPLWPAGMGGYKLRSLPTSSSALTPVISGESPSSRKVGVAHGLNLGKLLVMQTRAVWALRALWFLLPLTVGQAASDAVASAEHAVPFVMTAGLWWLWAAGMVASMVPLPSTLVAIRILAVGTLPLAAWALIDISTVDISTVDMSTVDISTVDISSGGDWSALAIAALMHAFAVAIVALNVLIGDRFVDGGSYGDERRMLLRPPSLVGYFLVPLLAAAMIAAVTTGPLLVANKNWIGGVVATALGAGVIAVGTRALHQLVQRWIVFVPNGMVLHDFLVVTEPVLFRRTAIERLGAAIDGSPARDLSNKAAGLLLECELTDPAPLGLRDPADRKAASLTDVRRFLFCPSRPGELLNEAERRNIATD